jgi:hypothetical protein
LFLEKAKGRCVLFALFDKQVFGFLDVIKAFHPNPCFHGTPTANELGQTLKNEKETGNRDQSFEEINLDTGR